MSLCVTALLLFAAGTELIEGSTLLIIFNALRLLAYSSTSHEQSSVVS